MLITDPTFPVWIKVTPMADPLDRCPWRRLARLLRHAGRAERLRCVSMAVHDPTCSSPDAPRSLVARPAAEGIDPGCEAPGYATVSQRIDIKTTSPLARFSCVPR